MNSWEDVLIVCPSWQNLPGALNAIAPSLPIEVRKQVTEMMVSYISRFGPQGVFDRMNNRTISRILSEFDGGQGKRIVSGAMEQIRFELFEAPAPQIDDSNQA